MRCRNEPHEDNSADWKVFEFAQTGGTSSFATVAQWYDEVDEEAEEDDETSRVQRSHRIFCAAAQAMVDDLPTLVPHRLRRLLLPRAFGFNRLIELMVFDVDATFKFNYCEYLTACRLTYLSNDAVTRANTT